MRLGRAGLGRARPRPAVPGGLLAQPLLLLRNLVVKPPPLLLQGPLLLLQVLLEAVDTGLIGRGGERGGHRRTSHHRGPGHAQPVQAQNPPVAPRAVHPSRPPERILGTELPLGVLH